MLFNSLAFAIFLPIVFLVYWRLPDKYRVFFLFLSSYYFYMSWNVKYVVLILFTTLISYVAAIGIEKTENRKFLIKKLAFFSVFLKSILHIGLTIDKKKVIINCYHMRWRVFLRAKMR